MCESRLDLASIVVVKAIPFFQRLCQTTIHLSLSVISTIRSSRCIQLRSNFPSFKLVFLSVSFHSSFTNKSNRRTRAASAALNLAHCAPPILNDAGDVRQSPRNDPTRSANPLETIRHA